jgi:hypothetical protein
MTDISVQLIAPQDNGNAGLLACSIVSFWSCLLGLLSEFCYLKLLKPLRGSHASVLSCLCGSTCCRLENSQRILWFQRFLFPVQRKLVRFFFWMLMLSEIFFIFLLNFQRFFLHCVLHPDVGL